MAKLNLSTQLAIAKEENNQLRGVLYERDKKIELMRTRLDYMAITERRFDQLLEGMCMGMKEASLPRRSS